MFKGIYSLYHLMISASLWLTLGSSTMVIFILAASGLANPAGYPDPFARYADLRPGQPVSVLKPFDCITDYFPGIFYPNTCHFFPNDGVFTSVMVKESDDQIQVVTFYTGSLRVVDLVRRWGQPSRVVRDTHFYIVIWDQGLATYTVSNQRRFSYQLPIQFVTLSSAPPPSK